VFCDIWVIQHQAVEKSLNFFKTTRAFRNAYESFLKNEKTIKDTIETVTLQDVDQNQIDSHICTMNDKNDEKDKKKICICDQIHLFSYCSYIVSINRSFKWKKNIKIRNKTRQKIQQKFYFYHSIKRIADINILDEMTSSSKRRRESEEEKSKTLDSDESFFSYANSTLANSTLRTSYHSLMNSVIYDSSCSQSLIFDRIRFLNDLILSDDHIKTSDDQMQVEEYEIMRVCERLKNKSIEMTIKKTAYIFICIDTFVSQHTLEKERLVRMMILKQSKRRRTLFRRRKFDFLIESI
jgi:hypothetical protein